MPLTFLAPGTGFVEDNFSMDWGWGDGLGMIQAHFIYCALYFWRRRWHPTPVLLPGKSHGRRSLEGYSPWGR